MQVECVCGRWHNVSPTGLALVLHAYANGDLQTVGKQNIVANECIGKAFDDDRVKEFQRRYVKNDITFDGRNFKIPLEVTPVERQ